MFMGFYLIFYFKKFLLVIGIGVIKNKIFLVVCWFFCGSCGESSCVMIDCVEYVNYLW